MATTTTHAEFIPEIWANYALQAFRKFTVMSALVPRFSDPVFAVQGDVFHIPSMADLSVGTRTEGSTMTFEEGDASEQTLTLDKWDYVAFTSTDLAQMQANQAIMEMMITNAMQVLAEKIDRTLLGIYASAGSSQGTGEVALDGDDWLTLDKTFNDNSVPMDNRMVVLSTKARKEYLAILTQAGYANSVAGIHPGAATAVEAAEMANLYGFRPFLDNQVLTTGTTPVVTHNLAFHPSAVLMATRPLKLPNAGEGVNAGYASLDNLSIRVLKSFDHATTRERISFDVLYGVKVLRPTALVDFRN